jgi:hypothetical protein
MELWREMERDGSMEKGLVRLEFLAGATAVEVVPAGCILLSAFSLVGCLVLLRANARNIY